MRSTVTELPDFDHAVTTVDPAEWRVGPKEVEAQLQRLSRRYATKRGGTTGNAKEPLRYDPAPIDDALVAHEGAPSLEEYRTSWRARTEDERRYACGTKAASELFDWLLEHATYSIDPDERTQSLHARARMLMEAEADFPPETRHSEDELVQELEPDWKSIFLPQVLAPAIVGCLGDEPLPVLLARARRVIIERDRWEEDAIAYLEEHDPEGALERTMRTAALELLRCRVVDPGAPSLPATPHGNEHKADDAGIVARATDKTFDDVAGQGPCVVDFYADHCGGCVELEPVFEDAAFDTPWLTFARVDCEANVELVHRFGITGLPTLIYLRNGQEAFREIGSRTRSELDQAIERLQNSADANGSEFGMVCSLDGTCCHIVRPDTDGAR